MDVYVQLSSATVATLVMPSDTTVLDIKLKVQELEGPTPDGWCDVLSLRGKELIDNDSSLGTLVSGAEATFVNTRLSKCRPPLLSDLGVAFP